MSRLYQTWTRRSMQRAGHSTECATRRNGRRYPAAGRVPQTDSTGMLRYHPVAAAVKRLATRWQQSDNSNTRQNVSMKEGDTTAMEAINTSGDSGAAAASRWVESRPRILMFRHWRRVRQGKLSDCRLPGASKLEEKQAKKKGRRSKTTTEKNRRLVAFGAVALFDAVQSSTRSAKGYVRI